MQVQYLEHMLACLERVQQQINQQPIFSIKASGSEPELRDKFISVIYKTLQDITINGLDKKLLEAALNSTEFKMRESDFGAYPKGLIYGIGVMDNWLYDRRRCCRIVCM